MCRESKYDSIDIYNVLGKFVMWMNEEKQYSCRNRHYRGLWRRRRCCEIRHSNMRISYTHVANEYLDLLFTSPNSVTM